MKKKPLATTAGITTSLDLDRIVFDGDRDMRAALMRDHDFAQAVRELAPGGETPSLAIRRSMLMTSVRLTPRLAPDLYACVEHCTRALGITDEVEVFCSQDSAMNAFIVPPQGNRLCIGFSNVALERFDDDELRFVLGHELGHALFKHSEVPMQVAQGNPLVSPLNTMRLHAWSRYAELSCDRVGLICCGDFEVAARTFFKLTSGLTGARWMRHVTGTALHYAAQEASSFGPGDELDWFATHPYSPLRVKALDLFARSKTYHRLIGDNGGSLSEADLEAQVSAIVELMNPSVLSEKVTCRSELKEFLALGGVAVARADGKVQRSELKAVAALLGADADGRLAAVRTMDDNAIGERLSELAGVLRTKLAPVRWLKACEDLCSVALADGTLSEEELGALYAVASLLNVEPGFIDAVMQRAGKSLD